MSYKYEDWSELRMITRYPYCDFGEDTSKEKLYQEFKERLIEEVRVESQELLNLSVLGDYKEV